MREMHTGAAARQDVSGIVDYILDTLDAWNPGNGYGVLRAATPSFAAVALEGSLYIPTAFTSTFRRSTLCA
ncbi:MAG: hypothetical protein LBP58_01180 [Azoarcus sp.]|nr:hypothetical protein [Azoarcus sp.]